MTNTVRWTHLQEVTFDDFFGKRLSYEGFTMEKVAGGYHVCSNPTDARSPALAENLRVRNDENVAENASTENEQVR